MALLLSLVAGCSDTADPEAGPGSGAESAAVPEANVAPVPVPTEEELAQVADAAKSVDESLADADAGLPISSSTVDASISQVNVTADSFRCLAEMTPVRHFFVDNLLDDLDNTVAVANSPTGGTYPPGSVVQLVPTEVMVKHKPGWNAATRDWEFFELSVEDGATTIDKRGFADVVNKFGGNCFACHVKAELRWDLICEQDHGCDPIPVTREQIAESQQADPRCAG